MIDHLLPVPLGGTSERYFVFADGQAFCPKHAPPETMVKTAVDMGSSASGDVEILRADDSAGWKTIPRCDVCGESFVFEEDS